MIINVLLTNGNADTRKEISSQVLKRLTDGMGLDSLNITRLVLTEFCTMVLVRQGMGRQGSDISWVDRFVQKRIQLTTELGGSSPWTSEEEPKYQKILSKKSPTLALIRGRVMVSKKCKAGWICQLAT